MYVCIYAYLYPKAAGISQLSVLKPCLNLLYSLTGIIHTVYSIIRDTSIYILEKAIHSTSALSSQVYLQQKFLISSLLLLL